MSDIIFKSVTKIVLAVLLIGCLYNMSAQYHKITGVAVFSLLIISAVIYLDDKNYIGIALALAIAVLFNPIFKFNFQPNTAQIIYKASAGVLITWAAIEVALFAFRKKKTLGS